MAFYVDDFIMMCAPEDKDSLLIPFVEEAGKYFDMTFTDEDIPDYLGGELEFRDDGTVVVSQCTMIQRFLEEEGYSPGHCATVITPAVPNSKLHSYRSGETKFHDVTKYQRVVGGLQYYANRTRYDIRNAVREVSRYSRGPTVEHWNSVAHIMRYLAGKVEHGLTFRPNDNHIEDDILWYIDASFTPSKEDTQSVSGMALTLGGVAIIAKSYRQNHQTSSTMEAEVDVAHDAGLQSVYYKKLFQELGMVGKEYTFTMAEDNEAAISWTESEWIKESSKHVWIRYHRLVELVSSGLIQMIWVPSKYQAADALTKNVGAEALHICMERLMGWNREVGSTGTGVRAVIRNNGSKTKR